MEELGQNIVILYVTCPHCHAEIEVQPLELNCAIFRHGAYKDTLEPIDPHTPKDICDTLVKYEAIYGCGKPFQIIRDPSGIRAVECDYI